MKYRRKNGVSSTRNIKHTIRNKAIFISNRSTGTTKDNNNNNNGYSKLKSPEAIARLKKVKDRDRESPGVGSNSGGD